MKEDLFKNQVWMKIEKSDRFHQTAQHRFSYKWTKDYFHKGDRLLDIGCLFGSYLDFFKDSKVELHGLDIYENIMEDNKKKFPKMKFHTASILDMPLPSNYFDAVTLWETIEHIPEGTESRAFKEVRRIMKKGSHLFVSTPHYNMKSIALDFLQIIFKKHRHYKKEDIVKLIEKSGFKVEKVEYHGKYLEAIYWWYHIILKRTLKRHPLDTGVGKKLDRMVEKEFDKKGFMEIWIA
ncbi:MAG: methyltransferase domain-containing protein, partial [Candidatus Aenigmatarchaeota archaeon]